MTKKNTIKKGRTTVRYSENVWKLIRLMWENTSRISWDGVSEQVSQMTGENTPSGSVVRRRANAENWVKYSTTLDNMTGKELHREIRLLEKRSELIQSDIENLTQNLTQKQFDKEKLENTVKSDTKSDTQEKGLQIIEVNQKNTSSWSDYEQEREKPIDLQERKLNKEKIIRERRHQSYALMQNDKLLGKLALEVAEHGREVLFGGSMTLDENGNIISAGSSEEELAVLKLKMGFIKDLVYVNNTLWQNHSMMNQSTRDNWGIEKDDVSDKAEQNAQLQAQIDELQLEMKRRQAEDVLNENRKQALLRQIEIMREEERLIELGGLNPEDENWNDEEDE